MSDEPTTPEEEVDDEEVNAAAAGPLGVTPQPDGSQVIASVDGTEVDRIPAIADVDNPAPSQYETGDEGEEDEPEVEEDEQVVPE